MQWDKSLLFDDKGFIISRGSYSLGNVVNWLWTLDLSKAHTVGFYGAWPEAGTSVRVNSCPLWKL